MITAAESDIQRRYYEQTAHWYDRAHLETEEEHKTALYYLHASLEELQVNSALDVGAGTGRTLTFLKHRRPDLKVVGVEPVAALRDVGYSKGLSAEELREGNGLALPFEAGAFDLVSAFGVLHHVRRPHLVVAEMLRVARKAVFISDANNFGQGSFLVRTAKQVLALCGVWWIANLIKTGGKGYTVSKEDGLAYSYSAFNNYGLIQKHCRAVRVLNTRGDGRNPYRAASHVAILGVK